MTGITFLRRGGQHLHAAVRINLRCHNAASYELVAAGVAEQQATDMNRTTVIDRRHATQFCTPLLKHSDHISSGERCEG